MTFRSCSRLSLLVAYFQFIIHDSKLRGRAPSHMHETSSKDPIWCERSQPQGSECGLGVWPSFLAIESVLYFEFVKHLEVPGLLTPPKKKEKLMVREHWEYLLFVRYLCHHLNNFLWGHCLWQKGWGGDRPCHNFQRQQKLFSHYPGLEVWNSASDLYVTPQWDVEAGVKSHLVHFNLSNFFGCFKIIWLCYFFVSPSQFPLRHYFLPEGISISAFSASPWPSFHWRPRTETGFLLISSFLTFLWFELYSPKWCLLSNWWSSYTY